MTVIESDNVNFVVSGGFTTFVGIDMSDATREITSNVPFAEARKLAEAILAATDPKPAFEVGCRVRFAVQTDDPTVWVPIGTEGEIIEKKDGSYGDWYVKFETEDAGVLHQTVRAAQIELITELKTSAESADTLAAQRMVDAYGKAVELGHEEVAESIAFLMLAPVLTGPDVIDVFRVLTGVDA